MFRILWFYPGEGLPLIEEPEDLAINLSSIDDLPLSRLHVPPDLRANEVPGFRTENLEERHFYSAAFRVVELALHDEEVGSHWEKRVTPEKAVAYARKCNLFAEKRIKLRWHMVPQEGVRNVGVLIDQVTGGAVDIN